LRGGGRTVETLVIKIMIYIIIVVALGVTVTALAVIALKVDWGKRKNANYYEVTLFLGSGGHTGELCQLLHNFKMNKVTQLNVLITSTDKSS
jgi:hypothetical protein